MSENKTHDLHDYIQENIADIAAEYDRIQKRATEDPGTAGDQGEENWAKLLREWLPRTYEVVIKDVSSIKDFMYFRWQERHP